MSETQYKGAFVLQILPLAGCRGEPMCGRVEHIESGQRAGFQSIEELLVFLAQILEEERTRNGQDEERR